MEEDQEQAMGRCRVCGTLCGTVSFLGLRGDLTPGGVLVLLEASPEQDFGGSYGAGSNGTLLRGLVPTGVGGRAECAVLDPRPCLGSDPDAARVRAAIHQARPRAVVAFGDGPLRVVSGRSGVAGKRGSSFAPAVGLRVDPEFRTLPIWPTYDLDLVRRVPTYLRVVRADVGRAFGAGRAAATPAWRYHVVGAPTGFAPGAVVAYDIETAEAGALTDHATMLAATAGGETVVAVGRAEIDDLAARLVEHDGPLVGHNSHTFDVPRLRRHHAAAFPWGEDTMVLAYLYDETAPRGLESLAVQHLGAAGWKGEDWTKFDPRAESSAVYAARDVTHTLALRRFLRAELGDRVRVAEEILLPAHAALSRAAERGIHVDLAAVQRARPVYEAEAAAQLAICRDLSGNPGFRPNSAADVAAGLIGRGLVLGTTETGKPATDKKSLSALDDDLARAVLAQRRAAKAIATYVDTYEKIASTGDGRVRPTYSLIRTLTGRSAAKNQNVQNVSREIKDFFGAPAGRTLISTDYSAVEFRVAASVAQEATIVARYAENPAWDPHLFFAQRIYTDATTRTANLLALQYGLPTDRAGAEALRYMLARMAEGASESEVRANVHRASGGWDGKLSARAGGKTPLLQNRDWRLQEDVFGLLRKLRDAGEPAHVAQGAYDEWALRASSGRESQQQHGFEFDDALQALSCATPLQLNAVDKEWKARRQIAKASNFSLLFLGTAATLQEYLRAQGVELSIQACDTIARGWHETFPGFMTWYAATKRTIWRTGEIATLTGHVRHFGDLRIMSPRDQASALRQAANVQVQGLAAHLAYVAAAALDAAGVYVVGFVHDAFLYECDAGREAEAAAEVERIMVEAPMSFMRRRGSPLAIPLAVESSW